MARQNVLRLIGAAVLAAFLGGCAQTRTSAPVAALATPQEAPAPPSVQNLVGTPLSVLNAEFGQPALRRIDGAAQVWLYHSTTCGLNLILYPDSAGVPRVAAAVPDNGDAASCMASLQRNFDDAALERAPAS